MTLNTVTLTWDLADLIQAGQSATLTIEPTAQLTDTADGLIVGQVPRSVPFAGGRGRLAGIIGTDNGALVPAGWGYTIRVTLASGQVVFGPFTAFINFADGASQDLSALVPVEDVTTMAAYLPLPAGIPSAGQVPVATGSGTASVWGTAGNPMTTLGDILYGAVNGTATRLPGNTTTARQFLRQAGTGTVSAAPAWDTLQAGDIPALPYDAVGAAAAALSAAEAASDPVGSAAAETARAQAAEALLAPLASPTKTVTTTNTTLTTDSVTLCDATSGSFINTLPSATVVPAGVPYVFKKTDATANEVRLLPVSSQTIDGATYRVLASPNDSITLRSNGTNWEAF